MKIKMLIDNKQYSAKPEGIEIGGIINRLTIDKVQEYSIEELKKKILLGNTVRPSCCGGRENTWQSQQIFMIDIDNKPAKTKEMSNEEYKLLCHEYLKTKHRTYKDIIEHCKNIKLMPNFIYTSFNHIDHWHKMRLVFVLNKEINDITMAKKIQLYLMSSIGEVDEQCKNLNRIYFAGKEILFNSGNILDSDEIIELSKDISIVSNHSKPSSSESSEKSPHNNKYINNNNNNIYIIVGTKTPKPHNTRDKNNILAIKNRDVEYLKNKLNHPHMVFNNNQEFYDYIFKEIDLGELLEFHNPKSFKCIFHNDNNPSAGIFKTEDGSWIYNCFGCGVSYNLLGVIEVLGKFRSRPKAYKLIREIFNLEIAETEWQKEQKKLIEQNLRTLDTGELEKECPQAYKNIKSNLKYLRKLLYIAMDNVSTEKMTDDEDNVLFFASTRFICNSMGIKEGNTKEISKKNTLFAYHKLLNKVDNSEVPKDLLKRSQAISINSVGDKNKKYRHINYYSIPSYNNMLFPEIEQQGQAWKENNYTIKGLSREMFFRKEGQKIADWLYPQYKQVYDKQQESIVDRTTTYRSDKRTERIVHIIMWYLDETNYCLENDIICNLVLDQELGIKKSEAERQLKKSLPEILDAYGLQRIRANKQIKKKLGIADKGYPFIIVKNGSLSV
ncbi:hypothetical protein [Desulforamulus ruminis]|uniref:hypothetical protein n=1 Tax=Desulforamulus ruminis TaxID=1564 RepID=UPI002353F0DE|nr:hypothetical protein [Desulforamulus ruminis]